MLLHLACCCAAGLAGALVPSCLAPVRTDVRIPPRLVQLWETDTAPAELEPMAAQWRRVAGWTARIWSDAENKRFIEKHYTWLLPTFRRYQKQVQRADIARLARLHLEGGVYSDLDTRPCSTRSKDLDKVLGPQLLTLVRAPTGNLSNFFIGSVAHHPFLEFVLRRAPAALDTAQRALAHLPEHTRAALLTMQAYITALLPPLCRPQRPHCCFLGRLVLVFACDVA
jgi:mannosyltransferase OCH1-like enzyme